ncbi:MAG: hypothetical protein LUQ29_03255, partial [Methylococcaceae bacterium]|nr:hypothetical protein [Methylococcaceae bacterium]
QGYYPDRNIFYSFQFWLSAIIFKMNKCQIFKIVIDDNAEYLFRQWKRSIICATIDRIIWRLLPSGSHAFPTINP